MVDRNKLVNNIDESIARNRNVSTLLYYWRRNEKNHSRYNNPCLSTGQCMDCSHPRRVCLNTVIVSRAVEANKDRIHLIIVN